MMNMTCPEVASSGFGRNEAAIKMGHFYGGLAYFIDLSSYAE
jgi:hypothetical protein